MWQRCLTRGINADSPRNVSGICFQRYIVGEKTSKYEQVGTIVVVLFDMVRCYCKKDAENTSNGEKSVDLVVTIVVVKTIVQ